MTRVAVIYAMVFAAAAGPWLCCCSTGRAVAAVATLVGTAPQRDGVCTRCCGGPCDHPASPANGQAPARPGPCPCKLLSLDVVGLPPDQSGSSVSAGDNATWLADPSLSCGLVPSVHRPAGAAVHRSRSSPRGSLRDRLSVLQTLRC